MQDYLKDLSPEVHYVEDELKWDVPVWTEKTKYQIYLDNNVVRRFTNKSLPDFIKAKITMATAKAEFYRADRDIYRLDIFVRPKDSGLEDAGWRVSENMYVVVLSEDEVNKLRGK